MKTMEADRDIERLVADLRAIRGRIAQFGVTLTKSERRRAIKFRPGGEEIVERLANIAQTFGLTTLPSTTTAEMLENLSLARRLRPLQQELERLERTVADTLLQAQSDCWGGAMTFYTTLARSARDNAELAKAMESLFQFFAIGKRSTRNPPPETSTLADAAPF